MSKENSWFVCFLKHLRPTVVLKLDLCLSKTGKNTRKKCHVTLWLTPPSPCDIRSPPPSPRTRASLITIMVPYRILEEFTLLTASKIISSKMQCNLANACLNGMWQLGLIFMLFTATLFRSNVKKPFFLREEVNLLSSCVIMIVIALI